jgi:hypothetical protein
VQHANASPAHTVAAQPCTAVGCHAGSLNGGANSDIAAIHNTADVTTKCATCHTTSGAQSSCTANGCHSGTDTSHVPYATGVHAAEASDHQNTVDGDCNNDCHSQCSGCHDGNYMSYDGDEYGEYDMSGDLPAMHAGVQSTSGRNEGGWNPGYQTNGCLTCHTPGTSSITPCTTCHNIHYMDWYYDMD